LPAAIEQSAAKMATLRIHSSYVAAMADVNTAGATGRFAGQYGGGGWTRTTLPADYESVLPSGGFCALLLYWDDSGLHGLSATSPYYRQRHYP